LKSLFLAVAAFFGMLSVALGAFAAHALRAHLEPRMLEVFQTGTDYLIYHALALGGLAILMHWYPDSRLLTGAGWTFIFGVTLFCGSLFALSLSGASWLGAIAPLGGLAFLLAWLLILIFALRI
jgi:uncharacterized membrane protein YgdD (TMEM256/DUF423 family)